MELKQDLSAYLQLVSGYILLKQHSVLESVMVNLASRVHVSLDQRSENEGVPPDKGNAGSGNEIA